MADKILNSFDVWIGAQGWKSKLRLRSVDNINLEGISRLRELILELAVRGKLLKQHQNDEPASLLLKRIASKKNVLINEGKISRPKSLPEIGVEEKSFEVANGWIWCRMQDISTYIQRGKGPIYSDNGSVQVISQKCIQWSGFDISKARFVDDSSIVNYQEERFLVNSDLLWNSTGTGTVGRINVLNEKSEYRLVADSHVTVIRPLEVNSRFLWCYLASPGIQSKITQLGKSDSIVSGTTNQVELNTTSVIRLAVPLPPFAEQHRIVAKVDELMALCDELEQQETNHLKSHQLLVETLLGTLTKANDAAEFQTAWATLDRHFDDLLITEDSIDQLKQTILQLAVIGKLVPQDPKDEPASVLLEKIKKEKKRLVEEGKIKKQKTLIQFQGLDEIKHAIPKAWVWIRLGDIADIVRGGSPRPAGDPRFYDGNIPFLKVADVTRVAGKFVKDYDFTIKQAGLKKTRFINKRTVLLTNSGATLGIPAICEFETTFNDGIAAFCELTEGVFDEYLHLYLEAISSWFLNIASRGQGQPNLNTDIIKATWFPLPPYTEQVRVVKKVDDLFVLCDSLKERIAESQKVANQMADSILEQV